MVSGEYAATQEGANGMSYCNLIIHSGGVNTLAVTESRCAPQDEY